MQKERLEEIAVGLVRQATDSGATAADVIAHDDEAFSVVVRLGKIELLKEAASQVLGLRIFHGTRSACSYTNDFTWPSLTKLAEQTLAMAKATSEDPASGLPDRELLGSHAEDLALFSPEIATFSTASGIEMARRTEEAALQADSRIKNSEGAWFESGHGIKVYANSLGFLGSYRSSSCGISAVPVAQNEEGMQRDYWYSIARRPSTLESPEAVGRKAAERAVRRLGARRVPTCQVPIVFDPETARSLLAHIFDAVRGDAIYRRASFLLDKLGQQVANAQVTILDDGLRPEGLGSRPFDDEGVSSGVTSVIERGVLSSYLLNCYTARKLNLRTTGNAARSVAGPPGVGPKNIYLAPGQSTAEEIIRSVSRGVYVTNLIGFGVNTVTGDYSRGAAGMWIEGGELVFPVEEVTIAGNLREMLKHIEMIGSDLEFRGAFASPTILVTGMTVAGT